MTLGQEFSGFADCIDRGADDVVRAAEQLKEMNLGATAVGTGLNAGEEVTGRVVRHLGTSIGIELVPAANHFRVTQSMGDVLAYSGALRRLAIELAKVASDLRLLSMGRVRDSVRLRCPPCSPGRLSCLARSIRLYQRW